MHKLLVTLSVFLASPLAHATAENHLSLCSTLAMTPQFTVTTDFDDYDHVDLEDLNFNTIEFHLSQPLMYRELKTGKSNYQPTVGPVVFYRPLSFPKDRQKIFAEVMQNFRPRLGLTFRSRVLTQFNSSSEFLDLNAFENGKQIDAEDIKRIEIFIGRHGSSIIDAAPTAEDERQAKEIAQVYEEKWGTTPDVHIYIIADSPWGRLIGHYSTQR